MTCNHKFEYESMGPEVNGGRFVCINCGMKTLTPECPDLKITDLTWLESVKKKTPAIGDLRIRRRYSNSFHIQVFTAIPITVDGERSNRLTWKNHPEQEWPIYTLEEAIEAIKTLPDVDTEDTRYYYPPDFKEECHGG